MSSNFISNIVMRMSRKTIQKAVDSRIEDERKAMQQVFDSRLTEELNAMLVKHNIRCKEKDIFTTEDAVQAHLEGYSDKLLNEYVIAKSSHWLADLKVDEFTFPPHLYSLLWVIQLVQARLNRSVRILDFGGGTPIIPNLLHQLGMGECIGSYRIIENTAFVKKVPAEWNAQCDYADVYEGAPCDLLILSGVLPYLSRSLAKSVYHNIEKTPPQFIYFGRTSFLPESYPQEEVFTIQESKFREHGVQVDAGMNDIEDNVARYVKRHFKWSEVSRVIEPLGYAPILHLADDSGIENIKELGLYSNNSLWERRTMLGLSREQELKARYWAAAEPVLEAHPQSFSREDAQIYLQPWLESMAFSRGPLEDGRPWMTFPAIRFLDTLLFKTTKVFEYGAGGSSVYFSSRVGELVSVEHDAEWFNQTTAAMQTRQNQLELRWRGVLAMPKQPQEPITLPPSDPLSYTSSDETLAGLSFREYASLIDEYPDRYFDVILIDGRARPSCFMHAMSKVRFGGYIILDNAERELYAYIEDTAARLGFEITEFWGPGPYNDYCWRTIFLRRRQERFALNDLDRHLEKYLDFDNGVFVEAGANDGIRQSNTLYLEGRRGWRGILIEAVPELYEECRRHRPLAKVMWAALAPPEQVSGELTIRYAGLMSVVKGSMRSAEEEDAHIDAGLKVQKLEAYETTAPCATLSDVLDQYGVSHVDLLSLDLEGFEAQALTGLDLSRHRPTYILVEARYRADVDARLLQHYEAVAELTHYDVLYRRRKDF